MTARARLYALAVALYCALAVWTGAEAASLCSGVSRVLIMCACVPFAAACVAAAALALNTKKGERQ